MTTIQKASLDLTAYCFEKLEECIFDKLNQSHPGILNSGVSQLYGFGSFQTNLPSLKSVLQNHSGISINGKYFYEKKRELKSGKSIININRNYARALIGYLGYQSATAFIEDQIDNQAELQKQLDLINNSQKNETYYYVSYHYGEYKEIVKSQVTIKDNWKASEYKYLYPGEHGRIEEYIYYGNIKKRADALHVQTRTLMEGRMVLGGEDILYVGYGDPSKSKFILGVFSAFDINNRLIVGKRIYERCSTKEEMVQRSLDKKIPGYIAQEIRNERIENEIKIPDNKLEISDKGPYYSTYENLAGEYKFNFDNQDSSSNLSFVIDPDTFKITSLDSSVLINRDTFELIQNGSVVHFSFKLTGLTPLLQIDIYIKTYYLKSEKGLFTGVYSGIDIENRLVQGETKIHFKATHQI